MRGAGWIGVWLLMWPVWDSAVAAPQAGAMKEDPEHVRTWNRFADALVELHQALTSNRSVRTTEILGGYGGSRARPDFYREVRYYDAVNGELLSRIQWETEHPDTVHMIEVFIRDADGLVVRDYLAAFLPDFRNAPIQTLINFHHRDGELHAFRQFDASGNRIYEQCRGRHFDEQVNMFLEDYELSAPIPLPVLSSETYLACFGDLPAEVGRFADPRVEQRDTGGARMAARDASAVDDADDLQRNIRRYTAILEADPGRADVLVKRGDAYFTLHDFASAITDYSAAIKLDNTLDAAYFGRGMARGRAGLIDEGIADLSVYVKRNPDSSRGYTKRGVRYLWKQDFANAERDLRKAIELDANNAEARDDLGVILARRGEHQQAIALFRTATRLDPSYQKAYHNMALTYHLSGDAARALPAVNDALRLVPDSRESLLLKSAILDAMGEGDAARAIREHAEFLPEGNWSERLMTP